MLFDATIRFLLVCSWSSGHLVIPTMVWCRQRDIEAQLSRWDFGSHRLSQGYTQVWASFFSCGPR